MLNLIVRLCAEGDILVPEIGGTLAASGTSQLTRIIIDELESAHWRGVVLDCTRALLALGRADWCVLAALSARHCLPLIAVVSRVNADFVTEQLVDAPGWDGTLCAVATSVPVALKALAAVKPGGQPRGAAAAAFR